MTLIKLLFLNFTLLFFSCGMIPPKWIKYNGGKQAVASAYHLSRKPFVFIDLIDTSAFYFTEEELVITNKWGEKIADKTTYYRYMRFDKTGIMFDRSHMLDYPTDEIVNKMERGQYCFYTVKDSTLKIEFYNHDLRKFEYWFGKIQENGDIYFYKNKGRPWGTYKGKLNYLYRKTPANLTTPIIFPDKSWEGEEIWY